MAFVFTDCYRSQKHSIQLSRISIAQSQTECSVDDFSSNEEGSDTQMTTSSPNSPAPPLSHPCLSRVSTNHFRDQPLVIHRSPTIDPNIMHQFASYPYCTHNKILVNGFFLDSIYYFPESIMDICSKYYILPENGIYQLAHIVYDTLKRCKDNHTFYIRPKLLRTVIRKHLQLRKRDDRKAKTQFYCKELVRLNYLRKDEAGFYQFTISKAILFRTV